MVAVGGGYEGDVAELLPHFRRAEFFTRKRFNGRPQFRGQVASHGVSPAQHLEGVEPETLGFVLDENATQTKIGGQRPQPDQRGGRVFGKTLVKSLRPRGFLQAVRRKPRGLPGRLFPGVDDIGY